MRKITAKKLPSGSWHCQVMSNGIRRSFTAATKIEAEQAAAEWKLSGKSPNGTLGQAIDRYISSREKILSPSTLRRYRKFQELNFKSLQRRSLATITQSDVQQEMNAMKSQYSAKTVRNAWGFLCAVFRENGINYTVTLPQVVEAPHAFLEPEQIKPFVDALKGEKLELPILLALHGLRRSEVMDLEWKDIDLKKSALNVSGAAVMDSDGIWVHKAENKNQSSRRTVPILIPRLKELLEETPKNGKYVVSCNPNSIYNAANRVCEKLGFPKVGVHGLRHTFVSLCYHKGISELATMKLCGYADFRTMRKIYTHLAKSDLDTAAQSLTDFFS